MRKEKTNNEQSVFLNRRAFLKGVCVTAASFALSCAQEDVLAVFSDINGDSTAEYGTGSDGDITVYYDAGNIGWYPVSIKSLYEDDVVNGVITWRGTNKGLNKKNVDPTDLYDPLNGKYINAENFTLQGNASISGPTYDGTDESGIFEIRCRGILTVEAGATIDMSKKGFSGGVGVYHNDDGSGPGNNGAGTGYGYGSPSVAGGGSGGALYGDVTLVSSDITQLIGSGGGSGSANVNGEGSVRWARSGDGGKGGGAIRLYAVNAEVNGSILAAGADGGAGTQSYDSSAGGGGGGSGGSIFFKCYKSLIGSGTISVAGGAGGVGQSYAHAAGGGGGAGFSSSGNAGDTMGASYQPNNGGNGASGYIKMNKNFPGTTIS